MSPSELPPKHRWSGRRAGFTLVELLVVIGIIAVLVSILLPALARARESSSTIKCAANVRSIVQGLLAYAAENKQYLPVTYNYKGTVIDPVAGVQTPTGAKYGYAYWAETLLGTVPIEAFQCPSIANGGLPATDPFQGEFDAGQVLDSNDTSSNTLPSSVVGRTTAITAIDGTGASVTYYPDGIHRTAYTLNEALCGRNKYVIGFVNATRTYHNVRLSEVENQSGTILATEFIDSAGIVSGVSGTSPTRSCKSHRPVNGWRAEGTANGDNDKKNDSTQQVDPSTIATTIKLRKTFVGDLWLNLDGTPSIDLIVDHSKGLYDFTNRGTRLDWVGRNHGYGVKAVDKKTNFAYVDGHVETKSILETVPQNLGDATPWEWGDKHYTIAPNDISVTQK